MSQNTLIEKIEQDTAEKVFVITTKAKAEVEQIQRETEAAVAELNQTHKVSVKKQQSHLELVAVSQAKQAGKIALQTAKREQIDVLFAEVEESLLGLSAEKYVAFYSEQASQIMPKEAELIVVYAPEARVSETETLLSTLNITTKVEVQAGITSGFIAHAKDGVYDVTLNRLFDEKRDKIEMKVVNMVLN
ncbi:MAG: V-type ATP synthase subunit E [Candidatus Pacebacteria bacterium]|nr:V-type ATP synthase subunit E [Candidatus Paceibacterota bacterium]